MCVCVFLRINQGKSPIYGYIRAIGRGGALAAIAQTDKDPFTDPMLETVPTFGCVYCAHSTGCYDCRGHGFIGAQHGRSTALISETCGRCLSACTACAFMRNMLKTVLRGAK